MYKLVLADKTVYFAKDITEIKINERETISVLDLSMKEDIVSQINKAINDFRSDNLSYIILNNEKFYNVKMTLINSVISDGLQIMQVHLLIAK